MQNFVGLKEILPKNVEDLNKFRQFSEPYFLEI